MNAPLTDTQKDQILESFIKLAQTDEQLKEEIKSSRNQDELIELAIQRGYHIDSLTLLRKWSEHTDFSQPTWMGWFSD